MSKSLQDQLLKAGLVDEKQAKKAKKDKRKKTKQQHKSATAAVDENKLLAQKAIAKKVKRDRELNLQQEKEAEQKAISAQIKQLIELNRQAKGDSDVSYNFVDNKKIKKIYLSEQMQDQLSRGRLAIVKLDDQYELVPQAVAEKIRLRDEQCVILCNQPQQDEDEDDPYADYKIPDDLMW